MQGKTIYWLTLVFIITLCTSGAWAQLYFPELPVSPGPFKVGKGFFVSNEPGKSFHEARQNFLSEEAKIAAADIRKGASFLKMEAANVKEESKNELMTSEKELETLAQGVENGTVKSSRELDEAFARAHQKLARSYIVRATEAWTKKEIAKAGQYLKIAISHLNSALAWSGQKIESSSATAVKKSRIVAGKLMEGTDYATEEVSKALEAMNKEIDKLGKEIEPRKK